jgi:hypothetical protein
MTFNVADFSAKVKGGAGLAKNNLFVASIYSPRSMNLEIERDLLFLCKSASIPGMNLETVPMKHQGWGKTDQMPSMFNKENVSLTFMVDSNFAVQQYFHRWMQTIVNYNELGGPQAADSYGSKLPYEMDYKTNYSGTLEVVLYASNDKSSNASTYTYQFGTAFPVSISAMETSWENNAEIMTITVSFAYSSMSVSGMGETRPSERALNPPSAGISSGGFGGSLGGAAVNIAQRFYSSNNLQGTIDNILSPINNIINAGNGFINSIKRIF